MRLMNNYYNRTIGNAFLMISICIINNIAFAQVVDCNYNSIITKGVYIPQYVDGSKGNELQFKFSDNYDGQLIQSMAYNQTDCKWLLVGTVEKKPERVKIWQFSADGTYDEDIGTDVLTLFSHPQDLSVDYLDGNINYWLPAKDQKSVIRFSLKLSNGNLLIDSFFKYKISDKKVKGLFVATTYDNKHLIVMGDDGNEIQPNQMVWVYNLHDFIKSGISRAIVSSWPLNEVQQDPKQWRQGLTGISNSIYVMTGNHSTESEKMIFTYTIDGELVNKFSIPKDGLLPESKTFEPEGLEIYQDKSGMYLSYGIAMGSKGKRTFELRKIKITSYTK